MKNTTTPLTFAALNKSSAGMIGGATPCSIHALKPHGPLGSRSQAPSEMKPKLAPEFVACGGIDRAPNYSYWR
jgi:hypothetical protein